MKERFSFKEMEKIINKAVWSSSTEYCDAPIDDQQFYDCHDDIIAYISPVYNTDKYIGIKYGYKIDNEWIEYFQKI